MPLTGPPWLSDADTTLLRQWIEQAAPGRDGKQAPVPVGRKVRYRGLMTGRWEIDGAIFRVDGGTRMDKSPTVGRRIEVRGTVRPDGGVRAYRVRSR